MFKSFFLAGFECATGYNRHRQWIDQIKATEHDRFVEQDYQRLLEVGIHAVREGVRWPLVDRGGNYDFSSLAPFLEAAQKFRFEVIYDLFHFGYPSDVDLFSPDFSKRFADYCFAVADHVRRNTAGVWYFTPINEPSYFSWAAGEAALFAPHVKGKGWELKVSLIRALIAGIDAIWAACPSACIVNADSLCRVVSPTERPELFQEAENFNNHAVFQSWDMLAGRLLPELGGSRNHLDIIGINYYWTNQWELTHAGIPLADDDPRRMPLRKLVQKVWKRYGGDLLITETSDVNEKRAGWFRELADEAEALLDQEIPLRGVCIYPALGMPEWHDQKVWTNMGLWDLQQKNARRIRVPCVPALDSLSKAQQRLEGRQFYERKRKIS
jgi:hypothetical protein